MGRSVRHTERASVRGPTTESGWNGCRACSALGKLVPPPSGRAAGVVGGPPMACGRPLREVALLGEVRRAPCRVEVVPAGLDRIPAQLGEVALARHGTGGGRRAGPRARRAPARGLRPLDLGQRHGTGERDERAGRHVLQQSVQGEHLWPVGVGGSSPPGRAPRRSRPAPGRPDRPTRGRPPATRPLADRRVEQRRPLGDERPVPEACGPARRASRGRRMPSTRAGRRASSRSISASRAVASRSSGSSRCTRRASRIASAERSVRVRSAPVLAAYPSL